MVEQSQGRSRSQRPKRTAANQRKPIIVEESEDNLSEEE